jgi:hypothetical protein
MDNGNFQKKYKQSKEHMKFLLGDTDKKTVQEAHLEEDDVIIVPGQGRSRKTGFIKHGESRLDHEVEMARSDLFSAAKNAKQVYELIADVSEEEGLEGWVQEKIIKANDYLNTVREYLEGKQLKNEMTGGVIAGGALAQCRKKGASNWGTSGQEKNESNIMKGIVDEAKAKQYVKPYNDPQTGEQIGWVSSDGYHKKYWQKFAKNSAIKHAKLNPDEVQEDYTGEFAAEKTPAINPYGGLKDNKFRGAISEISDTNTSVKQTGGFITPEYDDAYTKLKRVSPRLFDFIRYDAPIPLDPILTLKALRQMQGNEEAVLRMMKQGLARDTLAMYGDDHPGALAESVNRFWNKILNETPTDNPTGASGEGGRRKYKPKSAGTFKEEQLDEKCWDSHKQVGMKNKGGRQVPNCVPKESAVMKGLKR